MRKSISMMVTAIMIMMLPLHVNCSLPGDKPDKDVQKAFELRMNGKVDAAKALLEKVLAADDPTNAKKYFDQVTRLDPSKNTLILDMARYHLMKAMQNKDVAKTELPLAQPFIEQYLKSKPEPSVPLKAFAIGLQAKIEMGLGNKDMADKKLEEAKQLDPYFSKASGIPTQVLFDPPGTISHNYFSFFSFF